MKAILAAAALLALGACTAEQVTKAQSYQDKIAGACSLAMTLAPIAGPYSVWIVGACATESAIAKLALDPTSLAWLNGLVAKAKGISAGTPGLVVRGADGGCCPNAGSNPVAASISRRFLFYRLGGRYVDQLADRRSAPLAASSEPR